MRKGTWHELPQQRTISSRFQAPSATLSQDGNTLAILSEQGMKTYKFDTKAQSYHLHGHYVSSSPSALDVIEGSLRLSPNADTAYFLLRLRTEHEQGSESYRRVFQAALES